MNTCWFRGLITGRYSLFLFSLVLFQYGFAQTSSGNGMVVTDHHIASRIGLDILKKGGNAIDASIASAFALAVVHPQAGNIGGGGFLVLMTSEAKVTTIDFREKAPLAPNPHMFLDSLGHVIKGSNHKGLLSVGVPGTVAGLFLAHEKYGQLPWNQLVQPAIDIADSGFVLSATLSQHAKDLSIGGSSAFIRTFFTNEKGALVGEGEIWKQPELAYVLSLIRDKGKDGFYKGEVAEGIESYMAKNGGLINRADLDQYQAIERLPVHGTFKGYDIYSMGPPSSGGVVLIEMLNMMEALDSLPVVNSVEYLHILAEVMRRGYADRAEFLGDPDFNPNMPTDVLLSKSHAAKRLKSINMSKASISDSATFGQLYDGNHTTHFSVIDKKGNAVSLTYTLEQSYGSQMGSSKLGFIFNNEMGDFNPQKGLTSSVGYIGTEPNLIEPGKRMLSSMSPTIVAKDGKPYLIIGSPGGRTIINTVFQTVMNVLEHEMEIDSAIETAKIHHSWLPDQLLYEEELIPIEFAKDLEAMGHSTIPRKNLGRLMGIRIDSLNDRYIGACDSSSPDGSAEGY